MIERCSFVCSEHHILVFQSSLVYGSPYSVIDMDIEGVRRYMPRTKLEKSNSMGRDELTY